MRVMPTRPPGLVPRPVRLLIAARAVNQLGAFSLAFLTVLLCRGLGASLAAAGAVSAAFGLATIPSRLLGGRLADRLGRRRTILTGLVGCAVAQLGIAVAPDLAVAAGSALLLGLAFELYEPPSQAMIADAAAEEDRAPAYALLTTALAAGNMGAGLIADLVGRSNLRWLFVVDAASCLACALIVRFALPGDCRTPPAASRPRLVSRPVRHVADGTPSPWRDRALLAMTAAGSAYALIYMLILVSLPLSLSADGLNPAGAGLIMAASTVTLLVVRPLLRRRPFAGFSTPSAFAAGFTLMAVGLAGYAVAHTLPDLLPPTAAWSIGTLLLMGRAFALVAALAPPDATARYLAVYGLSWGLATVVAPVLGTQVIRFFGPGTLWATASAFCLVMAAVHPWLLRSLAARSGSRTRCPAPQVDGDDAQLAGVAPAVVAG